VITLLLNLVEIVKNIPAYILYAIETSWNLLVTAVDATFSAITAIIPLPEVPTFPYLSTLNWFFPVGSIVSVLTLMVGGYISFLAIRYVYKFAGAL